MDTKNKLLYETIVEDLKSKILNKVFKVDQKLPTELELAEQYGVSRITSRRALEELKLQGIIYRIRGSGSFVSPGSNIKGKSDELTISASEDNKEIITIMLPFDVSDNSFAKSVRGASEVLDENGYYTSVYNGLRDVKSEQQLIQKLYEDKIKGIIYYPISDRDNLEILNMLYFENYPIITIDKYFESIPISYVVSDNENGACKATQYLIDFGHDRIAFVSDLPIERTTSIRNRYFGYCKTLKENGIAINMDFVKAGVDDDEYSRHYQKELYQGVIKDLLIKEVTAIFAINDIIASFLMRAAFEMNIKIPDDISIIGFDDMEIAKHLQVPLTTISQDFYNMGKTAANTLINGINTGKIDYRQSKLPVELVIRESCSKNKI